MLPHGNPRVGAAVRSLRMCAAAPRVIAELTRVEFELRPPQPFRLDLTALALVRRPQNVIDTWQAGTYRRWLPVGEPGSGHAQEQFLVEASEASTSGAGTAVLRVVATGPYAENELATMSHRAVVHLFGLDVDLAPFYALAAGEERLAPLVAQLEGLRPPRYPSLYQSLLNAVPCQQVTLVFGLQLLERLARRYGASTEGLIAPNSGPLPLPAAEALAEAAPEELGGMGFSRTKARALTELAQRLLAGDPDPAALAGMPNAAVAERLQELYGVGRWTSEYVLLRGLGRLDVFPYGDSGARNGLARFMGEPGKPDYDWVARTVARWHPYAGFVYLHLLVAGMLRSGAFAPL